ncbi:helix-turn-helix domain-containing protein [Cohnella faecalis]|uniref:helix-turn-helix domain-containing protein n=1 Tax=Cohnella faecalis TaxID=2315694 RepID=UPI001F46E9AD|nr:helix-turn-helix domain-containing protein [Cohnella faecalis]
MQHYWVVRWDLRGQEPYRQTVLTHPNVNLVFEKDSTRIYGISRATTTRLVEGFGGVVGIKFKPAGFYPFWKTSMSELTDRSISLKEAFGVESGQLEDEILSHDEIEPAIERAESFLIERLPEPDSNAELINEIVRTIRDDRKIVKVEDAASRAGMHIRTMQRLFDRYVGVSPKWVIKRYRLHEAAEALEKGEAQDWVQLSLELGYYDQSHFIRDFKAVVARSPEEYIRGLHA